jgi:hypothetical protein
VQVYRDWRRRISRRWARNDHDAFPGEERGFFEDDFSVLRIELRFVEPGASR